MVVGCPGLTPAVPLLRALRGVRRQKHSTGPSLGGRAGTDLRLVTQQCEEGGKCKTPWELVGAQGRAEGGHGRLPEMALELRVES